MCKTPIAYLLHSRALCDFGCVRPLFYGRTMVPIPALRGDYRGVRVLYQPHGDLFGARALSGKRCSGGEQLLCLCLSWDAVGVGYQGGGSVSPSGV